MYSIVEFDEDERGGLAIVHEKWFTPRKKEVFWPPYKDNDTYVRSLKRGEDVNKDTWHVYGIVRNFLETNDLDKTRRKLAVAELTSDLNTDIEENLRRKRTRPKRFDSSTEEEEEDESYRNFPHPPKISCTKLSEKHCNKGKSTQQTYGSNCNSSVSTNVNLKTPLRELLSPIDNNVASSQFTTSDLNQFAFSKNILRLLMTIKQQNEDILTILKKKDNHTLTCLPDNIPVQLPVELHEHLMILEEYLENNDNSSLLMV